MKNSSFVIWWLFARDGYLSRFWYIIGIFVVAMAYYGTRLVVEGWGKVLATPEGDNDYFILKSILVIAFATMSFLTVAWSGAALFRKRVWDMGLKNRYSDISLWLAALFVVLYVLELYFDLTAAVPVIVMVLLCAALPPSNFFVERK